LANVKVISNSKELIKQLNEAAIHNPEQTVKVMTEIAIDIAGRSAQLAPIESGDLRNNCNAEINNVTIYENLSPTNTNVAPDTKAMASVGYSLVYALRQHEELNYAHDRTDGFKRADGTTWNMVAGGQAKYLETPFKENEKKYIAMIEAIPEKVFE